jgi:hypothetical protein
MENLMRKIHVAIYILSVGYYIYWIINWPSNVGRVLVAIIGAALLYAAYKALGFCNER